MAWRLGMDFLRCIRWSHCSDRWNDVRYMTNHLVIFVEKGALCVKVGDDLLSLEAGNAIWIPPGTVRCTRAVVNRNPEIDYRLHFHLSEGDTEYRCSDKALLVKDGWELAGLFQSLAESFGNDSGSDYYYRGITTALVAKLIELEKSDGMSNDIPLTKLKRHIVRNITRKISPVELARIAGLSLDYFSRKFKATLGISLKEFIKREKILFIARHLVDSDLSVNEVAFGFGYTDTSFFCRQFREVTGCSPQTYRTRNVRNFSDDVSLSH